jgi:hypothetical protein
MPQNLARTPHRMLIDDQLRTRDEKFSSSPEAGHFLT